MARVVIALLLLILDGCVPAVTPMGFSVAAAPGTTFVDCPGCPRMVVVPAGEFVIGSAADEPGRDPDEGPQRTIRFVRPFAVGTMAVTRGEFARFARDTHWSRGGACYADRGHPGRWALETGMSWRDPGFAQSGRDPVVCVDYTDIHAYLDWLNRRGGGGYRLLSEAEYEYTARAGAFTRYPWGDSIGHDRANFGSDPCCHARVEGRDRWLYTSPGGAFPPNTWGVADLQGNVWEFTADCYEPSYAAMPDDGSPYLGGRCEQRVIRGAGWDDPPLYLRSANRYRQLDTLPGNVTGFRVAKTLPPTH